MTQTGLFRRQALAVLGGALIGVACAPVRNSVSGQATTPATLSIPSRSGQLIVGATAPIPSTNPNPQSAANAPLVRALFNALVRVRGGEVLNRSLPRHGRGQKIA
jgi:hypothetical protein